MVDNVGQNKFPLLQLYRDRGKNSFCFLIKRKKKIARKQRARKFIQHYYSL